MSSTTLGTYKLPKEPGIYRHWWEDPSGNLKVHVLFVGYTNIKRPDSLYRSFEKPFPTSILRCCLFDEPMNANRLTPAQWGGWWRKENEANND